MRYFWNHQKYHIVKIHNSVLLSKLYSKIYPEVFFYDIKHQTHKKIF